MFTLMELMTIFAQVAPVITDSIAEGNPVLDAEGNPTYETVIELEYVEHRLAYNAQVNPTCQEEQPQPSRYQQDQRCRR